MPEFLSGASGTKRRAGWAFEPPHSSSWLPLLCRVPPKRGAHRAPIVPSTASSSAALEAAAPISCHRPPRGCRSEAPPENAQCPRAQNLPKRWLMAGCWGAGRATLLELLLIGETEVLHSFGLGFWRQSGFKVHPCFVPGLAAAAMEGMRTGHLFSICFQSFVQSLS